MNKLFAIICFCMALTACHDDGRPYQEPVKTAKQVEDLGLGHYQGVWIGNACYFIALDWYMKYEVVIDEYSNFTLLQRRYSSDSCDGLYSSHISATDSINEIKVSPYNYIDGKSKDDTRYFVMNSGIDRIYETVYVDGVAMIRPVPFHGNCEMAQSCDENDDIFMFTLSGDGGLMTKQEEEDYL